MAHVIHSVNTTASGLCHHLDSAIDDSHHQYATDLALSADALLFGRCTYDLFTRFWPGAADRHDLPEDVLNLARALDRVLKLVVSSRPVELSWNSTRHVHGPCLDPGVTIGDNSIIGAGSTVTKNIPANVIAAGAPCRVIRPITAEDKVGLKVC